MPFTDIIDRVVRMPACLLHLIDLHAHLTRKYLSIFKYIQGIFKEYLENMFNMSSLYQT
jgi:hypothetical protein